MGNISLLGDANHKKQYKSSSQGELQQQLTEGSHKVIKDTAYDVLTCWYITNKEA